MAKTYIEQLMGNNEKILLTTRQHSFVLVKAILVEIFISLALIAAATMGWVLSSSSWFAIGYALLLIPLISLARDVLIWMNTRFIVTNRRILEIKGVFDKSISDSSLEKVNDVIMHQTYLGRMFGYGDIEILTASEKGINTFKQIASPMQFKTAMLNAKEKMESREAYAMADDVVDPDNIPNLIEKFDQLRRQGAISEEEFQNTKTELLKKIR